MTPYDKDEFIAALKSVMAFYGKELDPQQLKIWFKALSGKPIQHIVQAFDDYPQTGKFAPKPVDILGIVDELRQHEASRAPVEDKNESHTPCPPEIQKAWMWFIGQNAKGSKNLDGIFDSTLDIDIDTQERYLHIVNHEAFAANAPDAIPDEYKFKEVWG